jgi:maltokinase
VIQLGDALTAVAERLPGHLPEQRWSGAHGRPFAQVAFRWHEVVHDQDDVVLVWGVVDATHEDGEVVAYQLFVGLRPTTDLPDFLHGKEREVIGVVPDADGRDLLAYDALVDPDLAIEVLHLVDPGVEVEVRRPIVLEHSNSSVVFDEAHILKLIRRIEPGPNPDMAITRELAGRGSPHVLAPLAELQREGTDLAVLREFLVGASDGWVLARTSVRDLLASRLPPEECGGDFAHEAERLGVVLGELHVDLAAAWGSHPADVAGWVAQMEDQLGEAEAAAAAHPDVDVPDPDEVRDRYAHLAKLDDAGTQITIHGDLHLAQVIRVDDGWRVLDFEGEPARRRDDRMTVSSPLRDVAGIMRSLHYAAATGLLEWDSDDLVLGELARAWEDRNREAFLAGYLGVDGVARLLPSSDTGRAEVLGAFELDKAVYELAYELRYRPDHVAIPAEGILRLVAERSPS